MSGPTYADLSKVSAAAADAIRTLTAERDALQMKVASFERGERVTKLASRMISKGLTADPLQKVAADLAKVPDHRLAVIEEAVELSASNAWDKVASLGDNAPSAGLTAFEQVVITGERPGR